MPKPSHLCWNKRVYFHHILFQFKHFIFYTTKLGFIGRAFKTAAIDRTMVYRNKTKKNMQYFCCCCPLEICYFVHYLNWIFHVWMWHRNQWKYSISTENSVFRIALRYDLKYKTLALHNSLMLHRKSFSIILS